MGKYLKVKHGLVYGKFQPFHLGHLDYIRTAAKKCQILFIGIAYPNPIETYPKDPDKPENTSPLRNPFNFYERLLMITNSLLEDGMNPRKFFVVPHQPIYLEPKFSYNYLPKDTVIFYGVISDWERIKLNRAVANGFKVNSFVLKGNEHISGIEVRRRMANDENWEELVPKAVAKVIRGIDGVRKVKELYKNNGSNSL